MVGDDRSLILEPRQMITRRDFIGGLAAAGVASVAGRPAFGAGRRKLPIAAVVTTYHNNAHADVIIGKVLEGWRQDGKAGPDLKLVSMFTDQVPDEDLSRGLAAKHGFEISGTIEQAIGKRTGGERIEGAKVSGLAGLATAAEEFDRIEGRPPARFVEAEDAHLRIKRRRGDWQSLYATTRRCGGSGQNLRQKRRAGAA